MIKAKKFLIIATAALFLTPFGESVVDARAGADCTKVGQIRKFGGVSYTCTPGKGKKGRKTWVATGTSTPAVTTATWNCGSPFTNDRYPVFQLDKLWLKPATQSAFTYRKDSICRVDVEWTPSSDRKLNEERNVSVCSTGWHLWPDDPTTFIRCSDPYYLPSNGRLTINWWKGFDENTPYYGFYTYIVKGYIGDTNTAVWESPWHLAFYDIDGTLMPYGRFNYGQLNGVKWSDSGSGE